MEGFAEEKTYFINLYSREIALYLYEAINAYFTTLDAGDPSLGLLENLKQKQQY